jgi:hypothetical protein
MTGSSMSSRSPSEYDPPSARIGVIACGALSVDIEAAASRRGWQIAVHPLPPLLHNRPERIPAAVEALIEQLRPRYARLVVAYADCGTYGALDVVCERQAVERLVGSHCYDVYAGADTIEALSGQEPGTYFLTDFLTAGFERLVWRELGLDRYPDLRDDYFRHYTRVVWLAQRRTADLERAAQRAADRMGLPLEVRDVSGADAGLEAALAALLAP